MWVAVGRGDDAQLAIVAGKCNLSSDGKRGGSAYRGVGAYGGVGSMSELQINLVLRRMLLMMTEFPIFLAFYFYFLPCFFVLALILLVAGVLQRRRWSLFLGIGLSLLICVSVSIRFYVAGEGVSGGLALMGAYVSDYQYDPRSESAHPALVATPPEVKIERQLRALLGRRGAAPLRSDSALVDYEVEDVHITGWTGPYPVATIKTRLRFADGSQALEKIKLHAAGGSSLLLPWLPEATVQIIGWRESPLASFFGESAPITPISDTPAPVVLRMVAEIETNVRNVLNSPTESVESAIPSDITSDGRLLLDVRIRSAEKEERNSQMLLYAPDGTLSHSTGLRAATSSWLSARGVFSPDGKRILYAQTRVGEPHKLMVREASRKQSSEPAVLATGVRATHHWVSDEEIAYRADESIYLHSLKGTPRQLTEGAPESLTISRYFRLSPSGNQLAYSDASARLWLLSVSSGEKKVIGWDVFEHSFGAGMAWNANGDKLAYSSLNRSTLPTQAEVWVRDVADDHSILLARFPAAEQDGYASFGKVCWANEKIVLFAVEQPQPDSDVRLLAASADGTALWDVTPPDLSIPFAELACANGFLAVPTTRTQLQLLAIDVTLE